jgi:hypothetical protein
MLACGCMLRSPRWRTGLFVVASCLCASAQAPQTAPAQGESQTPATEAKGLPPRATPADYQSHAEAGNVTVAAEFMGHSVPTPEATLNTDDYLVVEVALFGPSGSRVQLSADDFALRINGKKKPLISQPSQVVFRSLKDPEWAPPDAPKPKAKTKLGGGGPDDTSSLPAVVHVPIELQRTMAQRVQKASLPPGDRTLPRAGLIFFEYRGKAQSIHSLELDYVGPAGKATLTLNP